MSWKPLLGVLVLGTATYFAHGRIEQRRDDFPDDVDVLYVPLPQYLRPMSLGYREALGDLIWIRALIFSGQRIGDNDINAVTRYVDAISGLSPRFSRVYRWGGVTAVYGGNATINREMVDRAIDIYRRGVEQFPEDHQLLYPLGMLLAHQVGSTPGYSDEEKEALSEEGVEYIRQAAAFGADPLVRQYAATLVADRRSGPLAVQFLQSQLAQAEDEGYRRMLRQRLARLSGEQSVAQIERTRDEFASELQTRAPYLPDTIYAVIRDEHIGGPLSRDATPYLTRP